MDSIDHHPRTLQQVLAERHAANTGYGAKRRPLHHSPLFWCGVVLFVAAIAVYVFSDSLAFLPRTH